MASVGTSARLSRNRDVMTIPDWVGEATIWDPFGVRSWCTSFVGFELTTFASYLYWLPLHVATACAAAALLHRLPPAELTAELGAKSDTPSRVVDHPEMSKLEDAASRTAVEVMLPCAWLGGPGSLAQNLSTVWKPHS